MMSQVLLLVLYTVVSAHGFTQPNHKIRQSAEGADPGAPLYLTPYIESGNIEEAINLSRVHFPGFPQITSYAGLFTVDKKYNSNQFLWYFPAEQEQQNETVYLWLQGGPGSSSLCGLFTENGAFVIENGKFQLRDFSTRWSSTNHVIYIDNPVGAGFSFTNNADGYCTNQTQIGEHLYTTLIQFFQLFPELQKHVFIISGESYAGKYIPALGYTIHKKNPEASVKINLKGLMIGNGFCDPINQLEYGDYLYHIGLLDWNKKEQAKQLQNEIVELINREEWLEASRNWTKLQYSLEDWIHNISIYNYMELEMTSETDFVGCVDIPLINDSAVRRAIHVGNLFYDDHSNNVLDALAEDMTQSVATWISELLEHYHILFYSGQADIIVAYPLTENFLRKLNFSGSEDYLKAERVSITTFSAMGNGIVESFIKTSGNLMEALVRNAGHMVPMDQPDFMVNLMSRWRKNLM